MNWIGASQPDYVALTQHSNTEITFLTHIEKMLSEPSQLKEEIAPDRMRRADERVCHVNLFCLRRALPNSLIIAHVDEWNTYRANARMPKFCQRLLHCPGRGEEHVVVDGEDEIVRCEFDAAISLVRRAAAAG